MVNSLLPECCYSSTLRAEVVCYVTEKPMPSSVSLPIEWPPFHNGSASRTLRRVCVSYNNCTSRTLRRVCVSLQWLYQPYDALRVRLLTLVIPAVRCTAELQSLLAEAVENWWELLCSFCLKVSTVLDLFSNWNFIYVELSETLKTYCLKQSN